MGSFIWGMNTFLVSLYLSFAISCIITSPTFPTIADNPFIKWSLDISGIGYYWKIESGSLTNTPHCCDSFIANIPFFTCWLLLPPPSSITHTFTENVKSFSHFDDYSPIFYIMWRVSGSKAAELPFWSWALCDSLTCLLYFCFVSLAEDGWVPDEHEHQKFKRTGQ